MSPIVKAKQIYEAKREMRNAKCEMPSFEDEVRRFRREGVVVSNSRCFIMGKPILLQPSTFTLPAFAKATAGKQPSLCWFACCAVGSLIDIIRSIPYPLPLIAFRRRGTDRLRIYPTERLVSLASNLQPSTFNLQPSP